MDTYDHMKTCEKCNERMVLDISWSTDYYDGRILSVRQYKCLNNHSVEEKDVYTKEENLDDFDVN